MVRLNVRKDEFQLTCNLVGFFEAEVEIGYIDHRYVEDVRVLSWGFFGDDGAPEHVDEQFVADRIHQPVHEAVQFWKDLTPEWETELQLMDPCHPRNQ